MNEKKTSLAQAVREVYALVSSLAVSGDEVDILAEVRLRLRKIFKEVSEDGGG